MQRMVDVRKQAVTGVVPPQLGEAIIREVWPSVATSAAVAGLGRMLTRTIIGAPLAWLMMAPFYFKKVLPFLATRYTLTNQRVMIQRGLKPEPSESVQLTEIDDVALEKDANSQFFRAGTLKILSQGKEVLVLPGVPEPESFRHAILNACQAWAPGRVKGEFIPASAAKGS